MTERIERLEERQRTLGLCRVPMVKVDGKRTRLSMSNVWQVSKDASVELRAELGTAACDLTNHEALDYVGGHLVQRSIVPVDVYRLCGIKGYFL